MTSQEHFWRPWLQRADAPLFWLVWLGQYIPRVPGILGLVGAGLVVAFFVIAGAVPTVPPADWGPGDLARVGTALFFSLSIGLLLELGSRLFPMAARELSALAPLLSMDEQLHQSLITALSRYPVGRLLTMSLIGTLVGLLHATLLGHWAWSDGHGSARWPLGLATLLIWVLMFQIASVLIHNAALFSALGRHALRVDLLNAHRLLPFGRAALRPTLFLLGLQALYPLTLLGGADTSPFVWLGFVASLGVVTWLFLTPMAGVRHTLVDARQLCLHQLDLQIAQVLERLLSSAEPDTHALQRLQALVVIRNELRTVNTWPVGSALLRRILLYGIIPPAGWTLAALVEVAVESLL